MSLVVDEGDLRNAVIMCAVNLSCPLVDSCQGTRAFGLEVLGAEAMKLMNGCPTEFLLSSPHGNGGSNAGSNGAMDTSGDPNLLMGGSVLYNVVRRQIEDAETGRDSRFTEFADPKAATTWKEQIREQSFSLLQRLVHRAGSVLHEIEVRDIELQLLGNNVQLADGKVPIQLRLNSSSGSVKTGFKKLTKGYSKFEPTSKLQLKSLTDEVNCELRVRSVMKKRTIAVGRLALAAYAGKNGVSKVELIDEQGAMVAHVVITGGLIASGPLCNSEHAQNVLKQIGYDWASVQRSFTALLRAIVRNYEHQGRGYFLGVKQMAFLQQFCLSYGIGMARLYLEYLLLLTQLYSRGIEIDLGGISRLVKALRTVCSHPATPPLTPSEVQLEASIEQLLVPAIRVAMSRREMWGREIQPFYHILAWSWAIRTRAEPKRAPPIQEETFDSALQRCKDVFLRLGPSASGQGELEDAARAAAWRAPLSDNQFAVATAILAFLDELSDNAEVNLRARSPLLAYTISVTMGAQFILDVTIPLLMYLAGDPEKEVRCAVACTAGFVAYAAATSQIRNFNQILTILMKCVRDPDTHVRERASDSITPLLTSRPVGVEEPVVAELAGMAHTAFAALARDALFTVRRSLLRHSQLLCTSVCPPSREAMAALIGLVREASQGIGTTSPWEGAEDELQSLSEHLSMLLDRVGPARWQEIFPLFEDLGRCRSSEIRAMVADALAKWPMTELEQQLLSCERQQWEMGQYVGVSGGRECPEALNFIRLLDMLLSDSLAEVRTAAVLAAPRLLPFAPKPTRDIWLPAIYQAYKAVNDHFIRDYPTAAAGLAKCVPSTLFYGGANAWHKCLSEACSKLATSPDADTRKSIAASLSTLGSMMALDLCQMTIIPIALAMAADPQDLVRINALRCMPKLLPMSGSTRSYIIDMWCSQKEIWSSLRLRHVRAEISHEMLGSVVGHAGNEDEVRNLSDVFVFQLLTDSAMLVRKEASLHAGQMYSTIPMHFPRVKVRFMEGIAALARNTINGPVVFFTCCQQLLGLPNAEILAGELQRLSVINGKSGRTAMSLLNHLKR